ncbi:hypothetical protein [Streptomyces sp. NPDC058755]|uniref:hypothetical protein n=1 Tax=Streptomyces sp. NPDC058755 TaxID=3346624 RepID=UPI0036B34AAC
MYTVAYEPVDDPIGSVSQFMRTGKDRVRVAAVQTALTVDGVVIHPGDILVADDGAAVVPASRWDEVTDIARHIDRVEEAVVEAVRAAATLRGARVKLGYRSLQPREDPSCTSA